MTGRRRARELALQLLFQEEMTRYPSEEILKRFWDGKKVDPATRRYAEHLFRSCLQNRTVIDRLIQRHTRHWRMERMANVDRNLLRLGVAEFLYGEAPRVVVIDEAIEIARRFGGEDSGEFVNGILDAVKNEIEGEAAGGES